MVCGAGFSRLVCGLAVLVAVADVLAATSSAQANLITNGDFSANASSYTAWPGYDGTVGNPSAPAGWTDNGGSGVGHGGVNGVDAVLTGGSPTAPFGPSSQESSPTMDWGFLQTSTQALYQAFTVTSGQTYQVSYLDASRAGETGTTLRTYILSGSLGGTQLATNSTLPGNVSFQAESFTFTADSNTTDYIVFQNAGGSLTSPTVDFTDVSVVAVPEPAAFGLLAGVTGMLLLWKRKVA